MRPTTLSTTVLLLQAAALTLSQPLTLPPSASSPLTTLAQAPNLAISNAVPRAPALHPRARRTRARRTPTMTSYAPGGNVHVTLTPITIIAGTGIETLLETARDLVMDTIALYGDGLIPNGHFDFTGEDNLWVIVHNSNNHQTTWGVLARALGAVLEFMRFNHWGSTSFVIYDGVNLVGEGQIG